MLAIRCCARFASAGDLLIDVHGDENLPRAVLCCAPAWDPRLAALQTRFWEALAAANSDFCLADSLPHLITKPPAPAADAAVFSKTGADRMDKMGETGALWLSQCDLGVLFD